MRKKLAWSGAAMCAGYPHIFAELLDYPRALSFEEAPDYARWRDRLRALIPGGLPDDAVFDPDDSRGLKVGKPRAEPIVMIPEHNGTDVDQFSHVEDEDSESLPDSDDSWVPTSSWAEPYSVRDLDLIGDEAAMARAHLEKIEEPPGMKRRWLHNHLVEVMVA